MDVLAFFCENLLAILRNILVEKYMNPNKNNIKIRWVPVSKLS